MKNLTNTRILSLNPRGLGPRNESKMQMLLETYSKQQIDIILLNKTNAKWTTCNLDKIERKFKELGRETTVIRADSNL